MDADFTSRNPHIAAEKYDFERLARTARSLDTQVQEASLDQLRIRHGTFIAPQQTEALQIARKLEVSSNVTVRQAATDLLQQCETAAK